MNTLRLLMCGVCWGVLLEHSTSAGEIRQEKQFEFNSLTPELRDRIDQLALQAPVAKKTLKKRVEPYRDVLAWITSQTPMTAEEEAERAEIVHNQIIESSKIVPTPAHTQDVFDKLIGELPEQMKPKPFKYSLTVLNETGWNTKTVGAGYVYLSKPYLDTLPDTEKGEDLTAFVLAREIGHICREDSRLGYRFLRLKEELGSEIESVRWNKILETTVSVSGKLITFAYSERQESRADLFALHLCRNSGFHQQRGLDVLRSAIINGEPSILKEGVQGKTESKESQKLMRRLKHLLQELDVDLPPDELNSNGYGLYEFNPDGEKLLLVEDRFPDVNPRSVVFIHGMESDLKSHLAMMRFLSAHDSAKKIRILGFRYPNDGSLARSGKFLKREIDRVFKSSDNIDFVCHSAGGLVFRYYAEVEKGNYRKAVFEGTPHHGSDLAKLRPILEVKQFFGNLSLGYSESLEQAILDGTGQMTYDLQPESLFLRYLNRQPREADRYYIFRGRAIKRVRAVLIRTGLSAARRSLKRKIETSGKSERSRRQMSHWTDLLQLPDEAAQGDLAVTLKSAELEGAASIQTLPISHGKLPRNKQVMKAVAKILLD